MSERLTYSIASNGSELTLSRLRVVVSRGPSRGLEALTNGPELSVGTSPANDLVIDDPTVSRHHLVVTLFPGEPRLRDLDSKNGTRIAGVRVREAYIDAAATVVLGKTTLEFSETHAVTKERLSPSNAFDDVLGQSAVMRRLFSSIEKVAVSDATVLLTGETGCGKTLLASTLHARSKRASKPMVVFDCGAVPPSLIESALFGHVKGAFTGASDTRLGAFRSAAGGTLVLEEIGELPLDLQPKLLRALEAREVSPVGSDEVHPLDLRVVAATNRDLRELVNRGDFRADLYYRLAVIPLRVPALRERREDIALLAEHFHQQFTGESPSPELLEELVRHDWPGNVRELRSAIERAALLGDPSLEKTEPTTPRFGFDPSQSFREAKEALVTAWESAYLSELLDLHGDNLSKAAREARMDRNYLRERLRHRGLLK